MYEKKICVEGAKGGIPPKETKMSVHPNRGIQQGFGQLRGDLNACSKSDNR